MDMAVIASEKLVPAGSEVRWADSSTYIGGQTRFPSLTFALTS